MPSYIIGADESGTGAIAGPFTVCAYLSNVVHDGWLAQHARDSKAMSRLKRLLALEELGTIATLVDVAVLEPDYKSQRDAWRSGMIQTIERCLGAVLSRSSKPPISLRVIVDGSEDKVLGWHFLREHKLEIEFVPKADATVPQVSAASIFAKTARSERMAELHGEFPMYGWVKNDGYGTKDHFAAIEAHGVCRLHRRVRPLIRYFGEAEVAASPLLAGPNGGVLLRR